MDPIDPILNQYFDRSIQTLATNLFRCSVSTLQPRGKGHDSHPIAPWHRSGSKRLKMNTSPEVEPSLESLGVDRVGCLRSLGGPLPMFSLCGSRYQAVEMHGSNLGIALRTALRTWRNDGKKHEKTICKLVSLGINWDAEFEATWKSFILGPCIMEHAFSLRTLCASGVWHWTLLQHGTYAEWSKGGIPRTPQWTNMANGSGSICRYLQLGDVQLPCRILRDWRPQLPSDWKNKQLVHGPNVASQKIGPQSYPT